MRGDRDLIRRVLENLIDNAYKYGPRHTTINIEILPATMDDGAEPAVEIRVRDEGEGVPAPYRQLIFEKYGRVDGRAGAAGRGSHGLGLVFCRRAVGVHGGAIWVDDGAGRGGCFCVRLPVSRLAAVRGRRAPAGSTARWRCASKGKPAKRGAWPTRRRAHAGFSPSTGRKSGSSPTGCSCGCCSARRCCAIVTALLTTPQPWEGPLGFPWLAWKALGLGVVITTLPLIAVYSRPGSGSTRREIAVGQGLMTSLLIHVAGGRPEMHYAIFVSLPFLFLYRDVSVLLLASAITITDHVLGTFFWPHSVYGVGVVSRFAWVPDVWLMPWRTSSWRCSSSASRATCCETRASRRRWTPAAWRWNGRSPNASGPSACSRCST